MLIELRFNNTSTSMTQPKVQSYIKQAERNVIQQAKFWNDFQEFLDSMQYSLRESLDNKYDAEEFSRGIQVLRSAAYKQQQFALARCFVISAVGGEDSKQYSKERAKKLFGGSYSTMQWLDENFRIPNYWKTADEEGFQEELKKALED